MEPIKELAKESGTLGNVAKMFVKDGRKGYLDGAYFIFPQLELIPSGEIIAFDTEEERKEYIEKNNLKEGEYKDATELWHGRLRFGNKSKFKFE